MTVFMFAGLLLRTTLVLGVGFAALVFAKRQSAAMRHTIALGALIAASVVPIAVAVTPEWNPRRRTPAVERFAELSTIESSRSAALFTRSDARDAASRSVLGPRLGTGDVVVVSLAIIWLAGSVAVALAFLAGRRLTRRTIATSHPAPDNMSRIAEDLLGRIRVRRSRVPVRISNVVSVPFAAGFRTPVVVLPASAQDWSRERTCAVLSHELYHVAREDCVREYAMWFICAMYWFHPMVWRMAARVRLERERCCDDLVLSLGTAPDDYAEQLVDLARSFRDARWQPTAALAMASCGPLEHRVRDILDPSRDRRQITFARRCVVQFLAPALVVSAAAFHMGTGMPTRALIRGALRDTTEYELQPGVPVSWRGGLERGSTLSIRAGMGDILVDTSATSDLSITVTRKAGRRGMATDTRFAVMRSSDGLTVCSVYVDSSRGRSACEADGDWGRVSIEDNAVDFHVSLPAGVHLRVQAGNGEVNAAVFGDVHVLDGNGRVNVAATGAAAVTTYTGAITFERLPGGERSPVSLRVLHGKIAARLPGGGNLDVNSDSGTVRIDAPGTAPVQPTGRYRGQLRTSPAAFVARIQKGDISIAVP